MTPLLILLATTHAFAQTADPHSASLDKQRLVILTDIGGDPDDMQSMIRLMLYANEFDIEGLIASASGTRGELKKAITQPQLIEQVVQAYGKVQPNLAKHAEGYPTAQTLLKVIQSGNPQRGLDAIGKGHDTDGSRWIIEVVDRDDPRPVNIAIWGGQTDFAQALWHVKNNRSSADYEKFKAKLRVHDINDQDGIADWIFKEFPNLFYVLSSASKGQNKIEGAYRGIYLGGDLSLVSRDWMENNIRNDHGPLGQMYPPKTSTPPNPYGAIKEGDTPSWFYFLPTGLSDASHPEWGGWGGRFQQNSINIWRDAKDHVGNDTSARATVWRWRPAFQAEFQARLDWCVQPYAEANHPPKAILNGDSSYAMIQLNAKPGETVKLSAEGSRDSDGTDVQAHWFIYKEAGTASNDVKLSTEEGLTTNFTAPKTGTVHVILEVRDSGTPTLSRYRRAVVTIKP